VNVPVWGKVSSGAEDTRLPHERKG